MAFRALTVLAYCGLVSLASLGACLVPNKSHCGNLDGDATCLMRDPGRPHCSLCEASNDGCVAEPVTVEGCHKESDSGAAGSTAATTTTTTTSMPTTSAASTGITSTSTGTAADTSTSTSTTASTSAADTLGTTAAAVCGDGVPDPGEACDDGNQVAGDSCDACTIEGLVVFTSKDLFKATELTPSSAADALCDGLGQKRYPGAKFVAWISIVGDTAKDRIGYSLDTPYIRTDGVTLAVGTDDFLTESKSVPLDRDEDGNPLQTLDEVVKCSAPENYVWTGTDPTGNATNLDCKQWKSDFFLESGTIGRFASTDKNWTISQCPPLKPIQCSKELHIYCVQKAP